ncbi:response regulator [Mucilaginibacter jinjuensis]|uniref:Response regulator n=1 Tax=Mucilaginibacter jinjuensis TaxID=1176721 RepID=A0ABY7TFR6_9SPHI|nr:response regulator [Mucilaginibacter jinjuensis]WCT14457.1 response regulator [Mucilaginibacter jinjuensis]
MISNKKKVAIFDDDEETVSICQYILKESGWEVYAFSDCINPVEKIRTIMPDVILMDNWIPDEGGIVATRKLKAQDCIKNIPVIYFSAHSAIETLAKTAGAEAYLSKPFDLDDLEQLLLKITEIN